MSLYISLCTVAILANYNSEFRELLEATTYLILKACEDPHLFWLGNWTGETRLGAVNIEEVAAD
jgi:hypothetical protein